MLSCARILFDSPQVQVICGAERKIFHVCRDLLAIHSQYFRLKIRTVDNDTGDYKISLRDVKPNLFANYVAWLHTRNTTVGFMQVREEEMEALWALGQTLSDARFQNWVMDNLRNEASKALGERAYKVYNRRWPEIQEVELVYHLTERGSALRKLAADVLACANPLHDQDIETQEEWAACLERQPAISLDILKAGGRNWNGTNPWDDEHRASYMVPFVPLEQRWEEQILMERPREEIELAAEGGCTRSRIQLQLLDERIEEREQ